MGIRPNHDLNTVEKDLKNITTLVVQKNTHFWDSIVKKAKKSVDFDVADNTDIAKSNFSNFSAW